MNSRRTGTPDFNQSLVGNPTSPTFNQGEISNRVLMGGGSNSQSGYWLFASGFENGLNEWANDATGVSIENTFVYQGVNSCRLQNDAIIGNTKTLNKYLFPQGERYGLEALIAMPTTLAGNPTPRDIYLTIDAPSSIEGNYAGASLVIEVLGTNNANLYFEQNAIRTLITSLNSYMQDSAEFFHYVKFVFDPKTNMGICAYFDDLFFETAYAGNDRANANRKEAIFRIRVLNEAAQAVSTFVDNVVITAGEP